MRILSKESMKQIQLGDEKSTVVETLGSPKLSYRQNSRDYWVYESYDENNRRIRQTLQFYQGTLVKKGPVQNDVDLLNRAEATSSMQEYEELLRTRSNSSEDENFYFSRRIRFFVMVSSASFE
ncbi:MAG: outer membrane protein assembly factor BamE [Bdellovibrionales bacterium]